MSLSKAQKKEARQLEQGIIANVEQAAAVRADSSIAHNRKALSATVNSPRVRQHAVELRATKAATRQLANDSFGPGGIDQAYRNYNNANMKKINQELRAQLAEKNRQLKASSAVIGAVRNFKNVGAISKAAGGSGAEDFVAVDPTLNTTGVVMTQSGASPYLRSLLVPEDGPVSIPDSVMRLHHVRTETVTYNIPMARQYADIDPAPDVTTPVSGLLILYPNHPTSLIGYNFIYETQGDDAGNYVGTQTLTTAQDLSQSYDYGRRTSQLLNIQSSTLPSGMYAINGTFNAVRVDGTVSEMDLDPANLYSTILSATTSSFDKAGAVSVGNGISVLSIPDSFVLPYTRLSDESPVAQNIGNVIQNTIRDNGSDLDYIYRVELPASFAIPSNVATQIFGFNTNFDTTSGFDVSATVNLSTGSGTTINATAQFNFVFFDPFGNTVYSTFFASTATTNSQTLCFSGTQTWNGQLDPGSGGFNIGPIAGVSVSVLVTTGLGSPALANASAFLNLKLTAPNAKQPGVNMPVVYVAYQSVAYGSVLTLGGISNFELIPNPELRKNLNLTYGDYSSTEMGYVETVIANREKFDIRSVWDSVEYGRMKETFRQLADCSQHQSISKSFGWADLLKGIKRALPYAGAIAKGVFPQAAGAIDLAQNFVSKSASGRAIGSVYARASTEVRTSVRSLAGINPKPNARFVNPRSLKAKKTYTPHWMHIVAERAGRSMTGIRAVAFPTVTTNELDQETGDMLYAVFRGDYSKLLSADAVVNCRSADGKIVYGLQRAGGVLFPTLDDCTILPLDPLQFAKGRIVILQSAPQVEGHSCDAALWLLAHGEFEGCYPTVITGEIRFKDGKVLLESNPLVDSKRNFLHRFGIPLISNDSNADFLAVDLALIRRPPIVPPVPKLVKSIKKRSYACDRISFTRLPLSHAADTDYITSRSIERFCPSETAHYDTVDLLSGIDFDTVKLFTDFGVFHRQLAIDVDALLNRVLFAKSNPTIAAMPLAQILVIKNAFFAFARDYDALAENFNATSSLLSEFVFQLNENILPY